ncbi:MAG: sugar nucleotide-binding protein, partial [Candidatus Promineifilaceae bacterium]
MTRILITGGSSYLGQHLVPKAIEQHSCLYTFFSHDPLGLPGGTWLDVRDGKSVDQLFNEFRPEAIIHTAGSNRSEDMEQVIVQGASNISTAAMRLDSRLVHISTDVIFDGKAGPYRET